MIHLRGVSKQFDGKRKVTALEHVDLAIERGEMVSIVGPSGSGKSTLLNLIGGLDRPSEGEIEIDGAALAKLDDDDLTRVRRDKIGFIFQFFNLLPTLTCLENVSLPLHLRGWPRKKIDERARELLDLVQLGARMDHLPDELSGGERQRVAIARALSVYPPILLADEPTGNLDTATGVEILKLIHDLHERLGATVLIVTHDTAVAESCPRTIHIRDGQHQQKMFADDSAAADQLALCAQASAAMLADHGRNRARRGGVRRDAHGESERAGGVSPDHRPHRGTHAASGLGGRAGIRRRRAGKVQSVPEVRAAAPVIEATVSTGAGESADSGRRYAGRPQPAQLRSGGIATMRSTIRWCFWRSPIR